MEKCVSPVSPRRKKTTEDDRVADNFSRDLNKILETKDLAEAFDVQKEFLRILQTSWKKK